MNGETPLQISVLPLNSECSYEFLFLGLLSPGSGYSLLMTRMIQGITLPSPSTVLIPQFLERWSLWVCNGDYMNSPLRDTC